MTKKFKFLLNAPLPPAVFITGTDTGVGKTYFAKLLAKQLRARGHKVTIQKWIQSGEPEDHPGCSVYKFKTPASPHLAVELESVPPATHAKTAGRKKTANISAPKTISPAKIKQAFRAAAAKNDYVIVEGTGGLLVPYSRRRLIVDIVKDLKLPVIIVAENKLGVINHALLTIEALKRRRIKILGVYYNRPRARPAARAALKKRAPAKTSRIEKIIQKDNPKAIGELSQWI
jgi:dethiobiotin synthetase